MYRIGEVERKNLENLRKVRAFAILAKETRLRAEKEMLAFGRKGIIT